MLMPPFILKGVVDILNVKLPVSEEAVIKVVAAAPEIGP
jgi:hypothetical protein